MTSDPDQRPPAGWAPQPSPFGDGRSDGPESAGWEPGRGEAGYADPGYRQPQPGTHPHDLSGHDGYAPGLGPDRPYGPSTNPYQYGYGFGQVSRPRSSQAGTALVLSISGLLCCGIGGIIGAVMGRSEMGAIDRGESDPSQRGTAQAAFVIGLVVVGIHVVPFLIWVVGVVIAASVSS